MGAHTILVTLEMTGLLEDIGLDCKGLHRPFHLGRVIKAHGRGLTGSHRTRHPD